MGKSALLCMRGMNPHTLTHTCHSHTHTCTHSYTFTCTHTHVHTRMYRCMQALRCGGAVRRLAAATAADVAVFRPLFLQFSRCRDRWGEVAQQCTERESVCVCVCLCVCVCVCVCVVVVVVQSKPQEMSCLIQNKQKKHASRRSHENKMITFWKKVAREDG